MPPGGKELFDSAIVALLYPAKKPEITVIAGYF